MLSCNQYLYKVEQVRLPEVIRKFSLYPLNQLVNIVGCCQKGICPSSQAAVKQGVLFIIYISYLISLVSLLFWRVMFVKVATRFLFFCIMKIFLLWTKENNRIEAIFYMHPLNKNPTKPLLVRNLIGRHKNNRR